MTRLSSSFSTLPVLVALSLGAACSAQNGSTDPEGGGDAGDGDLNPLGDGDIDPGDGDGDLGDLGSQPAPPGCGNGELTDDEACDDGGTESGDGCSANCLVVEDGFICREAGQPCTPFAKCGDGIATFPEQCDDSALVAGDGCSANCKIEIGFKCDGTPSICTATTCGDGLVEGAELCDDGNALPFDGCSIDCQIEPSCTTGAGCTSACGDGIVLGDEGCDDGNDTDGDGCSSSCQPEPGYTCVGEPCEMINGACVLRVPVVLRDWPMSHPDFGVWDGDGGPAANGGNNTGMVAATLGADGKPVAASPGNVTALNDWFDDLPGTNTGPFLRDVVLFDDGAGNFVNRLQDDGTRFEAPLGSPNCQAGDNGGLPCPVDGNPLFFPLDDITNPAGPETYDGYVPQPLYGGHSLGAFGKHNFHFTTEVAYWFVYDPTANATLTFVGDDDVFVFINGTLAVDIGNKHEPKGGRITLGATNATIGYSNDQAFAMWEETTRPIGDFGLTAGGVYEIKVFHAERETRSSTFQLTLGGFDTSKSDCSPMCGDGILGVGEECDDGVNDGGYNECQEGCVLGGYCGDGIQQEDKACDDADPNAPPSCQGCRILVVR